MFSTWTDNEAIWGLDDGRKRAKLDLANSNLVEREFNSVVVEVKAFKITDPSSLVDLIFQVLLNGGDVLEPEAF